MVIGQDRQETILLDKEYSVATYIKFLRKMFSNYGEIEVRQTDFHQFWFIPKNYQRFNIDDEDDLLTLETFNLVWEPVLQCYTFIYQL